MRGQFYPGVRLVLMVPKEASDTTFFNAMVDYGKSEFVSGEQVVAG